MKLTTITVRGVDFDVSVDDRGKFSVNFDGRPLTADSLAELTIKLNRATRSAKIAIEFAALREHKVTRGVCTGKHASNHNLLVKWETGENEQLSSWDLRACVTPDAETVAKYQGHESAVAAAVKARDEFVKAHAVNLRAAVDAALENAWRADEAKGGAA